MCCKAVSGDRPRLATAFSDEDRSVSGPTDGSTPPCARAKRSAKRAFGKRPQNLAQTPGARRGIGGLFAVLLKKSFQYSGPVTLVGASNPGLFARVSGAVP